MRKDHRPCEPPMPEALAYFITWTTYGTWLPGDERGWVLRGRGLQQPDRERESHASSRLTEPICKLNPAQRKVVEKTIAEHCQRRNWELHAVKCRTNHVHVVVSAPCRAETARDQLKAWCTRRLKKHATSMGSSTAVRLNWWTERGSCRSLGDEASLEAAVVYVLYGQDRKGRDRH